MYDDEQFLDTHDDAGRAAYERYGQVVGGQNHRGEPMPAWYDLPPQIRLAWCKVAVTPAPTDPTRESRFYRKRLDQVLQQIKASARTSRERSIAVRKIQEGIMWLGMDLKAQKEEGLHEAPNPYPDSYDPESDQPISETADGLQL